jgi:hypothetical protein
VDIEVVFNYFDSVEKKVLVKHLTGDVAAVATAPVVES